MKAGAALASAAVVGAALVLLGYRSVTDRSTRIREGESAIEKYYAEAIRLRKDVTRLGRETAEAETQLTELLPLVVERDPGQLARRREISDWVERVRTLHELFASAPEQRTPQMELLAETDWIRIALDADLSTDPGRRRARAKIRQEATTKLVPQIQSAIRRYLSEKGDRPPDIEALAPFIDPPLASGVLEQFEVADITPAARAGEPTWLVRNRAPIDADYDVRFEIRRNGLGSSASVLMWNPELRERFQRATREYSRVNPKTAFNGVADLFPYFNPPLEEAHAHRLLRDEAQSKE